jgi:protein tyrosine phosphatase (PTP) superfamily phosphohydrolase (DUF442 family)
MTHSRSIRFSDLKQLFITLAVYFALVAVLAGYYLVFFGTRGNLHEVVSRKVYRSAQPSPEGLKLWIQQYNIRTVINLRGDAGKVVEDELKPAGRLGITTISIPFSSYRLPSTDSLAKLIQAIEMAELPLLIHCHAGVDRAGTASALAAMAIGKVDYDTAKWQAYVPPGPWKRKRLRYSNSADQYIHISDMFKLYEDYCRRNSLKTSRWRQFRQWAIDHRSLDEYVSEFQGVVP